jgi:UDP-N-acetylmuramoyl-L-alanyl-D-glutamate--2,6-diaminopimelate ligase
VGARCVSIGRAQGDIRLFQEGPDRWRLQSAYADYPLQLPMIGYHNAWNAAASAVALGCLNVPLSTALALFKDLPQVPGRLECCSERPMCYVDYAHTPQALATVQTALRQQYPDKKLITVFGCGGDRDHGKRAAMGTVAAASDIVIVCNDNPRSEDPQLIADMICSGQRCAQNAQSLSEQQRFLVLLDREQAIRQAFQLADEHTVILVAGKGHETEQIIGAETHHWDDRAFIRGLGAQH